MYASRIAIALLLQLSAAALPEIQIAKQPQQPGVLRLLRRGGTVSVGTAENFQVGLGGGYFTTVTVGTGSNPQQQQLLVDTASSDTFVLSKDFCSHSPGICSGNSFDPSGSSTYAVADPSPAFNTSFSDGSLVYGPFARDTITIGDLVVSNVQFGVAQNWTGGIGKSTGQLALGFSYNEAPAPGKQYPNLPEVLKDSGAINSRLYSIYLDETSESGSILFGGIDQSKYSGPLVTLDLTPRAGYGSFIEEFIVNITSLATTSGSSVSQTIFTNDSSASVSSQQRGASLPGLFCVGCAALELPSAYYNSLISSTFSFLDRSDGTCSCDHRKDNASLQLELGGTFKINVPSRDLIVPVYNSSGLPLLYANRTGVCALMVTPGSDQVYLIGESVLRSMYMVFDLDNGQISVAQAVVNSTTPANIHTIPAGPNGVASAASRVQTASSNTNSIAAAASTNAVFSVSTISSSSSSTPASNTAKTTSTSGSSGSSVSAASASSSAGAAGLRRMGTEREGLAVAAVVIAAALV
ncbi:hypothetical protein LTR78_005941 [Recurvomyces mirabilis]|uniref:Peptidase A1 domain-containing protein n=1 Tax=Recurvomyces mirabilis TaxID=574656 RepID=A0AAE1C0T6_9PEZI|nr:hypothetical protein LTR78_005941 [Recurvomyces mirabilis]KAK5155249.1 hypothetical protein LTS14_006204 [Recurvomyces mirabilis]